MLLSHGRYTVLVSCLAIVVMLGIPPAVAAEKKFDTAKIEQVTGLKGTFNDREGVFKVSSPRNDIKITVDGWPMPPFMGLTSWAAFTAGRGKQVMVMGDVVLFQDEINPVMSAAFDGGLDVTALHNHFFFDEPKVYFMHIGGEGEAGKLAAGVKKIFDKIKEIRAANPQPVTRFPGAPISEQSAITAQPLEQILGVKGQSNNGMFKVVIGRSASMHAVKINSEMGVNTWAAFAGTDDNAVVDGDFAMLEGELQTVLKSMRKEGINIVAIHHHMDNEKPKYLFLHYWGKGKAQDLARSLKKTLDLQAMVKSH